ncbi:MAG: hypothetical protein R3F43_14040 [bacterium]
MIISNPANGRAVVAAAGHETGPGANTAVGGVARGDPRLPGHQPPRSAHPRLRRRPGSAPSAPSTPP